MSVRVLSIGSNLRRSVYIVGGAAIFLWLRLEDNNVAPVAAIAWLASTWLIADRVLRWFDGYKLSPVVWGALMSLTGGTSGAGAALVAAALMLLKNGLHGHIVPDFSFNIISGMLARLPAWTVTGLLAGLGLAAIVLALRWPARPQAAAGSD